MSDGTRTHDRLDHNQELYQLSYAHHGFRNGLYQRGFGRADRRVGRGSRRRAELLVIAQREA